MNACPVCGAKDTACGHQPLRYPPLDLAGIASERTEAELEQHRLIRAERDARRAARRARGRG